MNTTPEYLSRTSAIFNRLGEAMFRYKWVLFTFVASLTIFAFTQMPHIKFDGSTEAWFVEGDPTIESLDKFREVFGNDDFVVMLFESEDFFEPENIRVLGELAEVLEAEVPYLKDLTWLGNVEYIESKEDGISIYELLETIPQDQEEMARVREKALGEKSFINSLISPDAKVYTIILEMEKYPEDDDNLDLRSETAPAIRKILARPEFEKLTAYLAGGPILHHDYNEMAGQETPKFLLFILLIQMGLLFWLGRGVRGVVVPISIVFLSIIWTMGAIGWLHITLNMMIIVLPSILICVGIGDSIHFIADYQDHFDKGMGRKEAMLKTFSMVGLPCLLTTLTTMSAFLSFLTVSIKSYHGFGVYTAIGVVVALVLTYILVPFFYSFGMEKNSAKAGRHKRREKKNDFFDRLLATIHKLVITWPKLIVGFFIILSLVSLFGASKIKIESNMMKLISEKVPIRQTYEFIDAKMGGSMSMEIMLDTGKTNGVKDLQFLKNMEALQNFLDNNSGVSKTSSILDVMKKMRRALHNDDPKFYAIPDTADAISQYLFIYESSGGDQLDKLISFDYDIARLTVKTPAMGTGDVRRLIRDVEDFSKKTFDESVTVEITGVMAGVKALNDKIGEGLKSSFIAVLIAVTIMMIIFMKSVKLGLISMIPNVFPVLITLGFMGFAGLDMDMALMACSAIIIGVAVDDTIHFFRRYRREFANDGNYSNALRQTLATIGRPLTFTTITLVFGFIIMVLSVMKGWSHFGFLAGFAFLWALLADFFFAPALMLLVKPLGPEKQ